MNDPATRLNTLLRSPCNDEGGSVIPTGNPRIVSRHVYVALLLLAGALFACDTSNGESRMSRTDNTLSLQDLETSIGIEFPPGTRLIHVERNSESDALIRAKLAFTPTQWASFVASSPLDHDTFEEGQRYLLGTNVAGWNPQDSATLPTAQAWLPGAKVLDVGVDRSNPDQFLVFLVHHGT